MTRTKRYAPYIEEQHTSFLSLTATHRDTIISDSPFADYDLIDANNAFFGLGYVISSFPSLQDIFGKNMAGLDIETLWSSVFGDIVSTSEVDETVAEEIKLLDDEIEGELTKYQVGMRNLNAVSSSSFVIGKAMVEDKRVKAFAKISLDARAKLFSTAGKEYATRLNWEKKEITTYAEVMKAYFMDKSKLDNVHTTFDVKDSLWPLTVLDFERAALATMQSVVSCQKTQEIRKRSDVSKMLSVAADTVTGLQIGTSVGGWVGAIVGAAIGTHVGIAKMLAENNQYGLIPIAFILPAPFGLMYE